MSKGVTIDDSFVSFSALRNGLESSDGLDNYPREKLERLMLLLLDHIEAQAVQLEAKTETLRERVYTAVSAAIGVNAPSRTSITNAVMAVVGEQQPSAAKERAAFVGGADWHARLERGPYNAPAEAATRYPDAAEAIESQPQREQVTREQVETILDRCIFRNPDAVRGVDGQDEALNEIMALFGGDNA